MRIFIALRKRTIKRALAVSLFLIFFGRFLAAPPSTMAMDMPDIAVEITKAELMAEGFNETELRQMGFVTGVGKIVIYNAKQKQIWDARVLKAKERIATAKYQGRKPNPRDLALIELDDQRKNPPKQRFVEKWFGQTAQMYYDHWKENRQGFELLGNGLSLAGLFWLMKTLAPLAFAL